MELGDVVDQFHDYDCLAHAGAAERPDFSTLEEWTDQINYLNTGAKHLRRGGLVDKRRRLAMDGIVLFRLNWPAVIHRGSGHIEHSAHDTFADWHRYRRTAIGDLGATFDAFGPRHRDGPDPLVSEVLLHLQRHPGGLVLNLVLNG
jgi:hypothetical protein